MYQLAVKHHKGDVDSILESINAIPGHFSASDQNASDSHSRCPLGGNSWCKYKSAIANCTPLPRHPNFLGPEAAQLICDVFSKYNYNKRFFVGTNCAGTNIKQ